MKGGNQMHLKWKCRGGYFKGVMVYFEFLHQNTNCHFHEVPRYGKLIAYKARFRRVSRESCNAQGQDKRDILYLR
jgi:hypothetical protein